MTDQPAAHLVEVAALTPYERNARTHSDAQVEQIKQSIRRFGFVGVLAYDEKGLAIGHGRRRAVLEMWAAGEEVFGPGKREVLPAGYAPAIDISGLTSEERRALIIADNQLALNAGWNEELLSQELRALLDADFDVPLIGFDEAELHKLLGLGEGRVNPDEEVPEPPENPVSRPGDLWILGDHRIICGSSTEAETVSRLLAGAKPHLMVTDPPYGVEYDASWRDKALGTTGSAKGKVLNDDRADWREAWALFPGDVAYVWHAGLYAGLVAESLASVNLEARSQIVWDKGQLVLGRGDYHWEHEPCWYAVRKGRKAHWNGDRKQTTIWRIDKPARSETGHSTQKPIDCMKRPIENNSKHGESIYEPFSGSGTTIIAGQLTGRRVYAVELKPAYVDVAVLRWQEFTGEAATLEGSGETYAQVLERRAAADDATESEKDAFPALS